MPAPLTFSQLVQPMPAKTRRMGCRLVRTTSDNARQWQRVKPDPEVHFLAGLDCEKEPTRG
jgi:hypothetical protein